MVLTGDGLFQLILNLDRQKSQLCRVKSDAEGMTAFRLNGSLTIVRAKNRDPYL